MDVNDKGRDRAVQAAIRQALMSEWDPIGVRDIPEAQDEYDEYVLPIYRLLVTQRPEGEVFDYLFSIETEQMELAGDRQATERFAARLMRISGDVDDRLAQIGRGEGSGRSG